MVPEIRRQYNSEFTPDKYAAFLRELNNIHPGQLDFRIAETPLFIPKEFIDKALEACESIVDTITEPEYKEWSNKALPQNLGLLNEGAHPQCIVFDYGICTNEAGELEPQLIELQGFPSMFAFQVFFAETHQRHFFQPAGYTPYLNGFTKDSYTELLRRIILGNSQPENVILLEIFPEKQKTRIDFSCTETLVGIKTVCLTALTREGKDLYYMNDGEKTQIERIYNRVIFDDLYHQPKEIQEMGSIFQQELNVEWIPHPAWFYRISKFTLPYINHPFVPPTRFLSDVDVLPTDLENYVVKPLFSFAGQGVIIDVTEEAIKKIEDPKNWILQKKVTYAPIIETPGEGAKAEIRLFYFWEPGTARPLAANNLARLSKGKMVGVRYNKDKEWVGGTFCLFEE
ncbi:MAG: hypothetical protein WKF70_08975 [Chitinophagaceae bacterium]